MNEVPNNMSKEKGDDSFGNMIIESENNLKDAPNSLGDQNINSQINNSNSVNTNTFPSSTKTKLKHKKSSNLKGDASNLIKCKIKTSLSIKENPKNQKNKNKLDNEGSKKLSLNHKNNQSNSSFKNDIKEKTQSKKNESNLSKINENDDNNDIEMSFENNNINTISENIVNKDNINNNINNNNIVDINNNYKNINYNSTLINNNYINNVSTEQNIINNSVINNEINFEYINVINNVKEIKNPPLISMSYKEFNSTLLPFEYLNDIWESFIDKEKLNDYSFKDIISTQTDIKESMRCILIDWIISIQNKFFMKKNTLFLTINLIDRYLSKKSIHRTKFQLLGVSSLFIACKYEEIYMKNINQFVELTARAFDKNEILEMEKTIIDLVDFNLDLPLSDDFFDILSTVYKFNEKEYNFGCFLLEAFLLDITCCEYKQSQIALATCFIVLGSRQINRINPIEGNNFVKYYCEKYKINFDIWKDYDIIVSCAKKIYYFYEHSEKIIYKEVYKVFNNIFI